MKKLTEEERKARKERLRLRWFKWYYSNRDRHLKRLRSKRAENPEKTREIGRFQARKWKAANPEKSKAIQRAWYYANREKLLKARRERMLANKEKLTEQMRQWRAVNNDKVKEAKKRVYRRHRRDLLELSLLNLAINLTTEKK